jgi:prevent-host-death family protein
MDSRVGTLYARQHWRELLERAGRGQSTTITRHGRPIAAVVPPDALRDAPASSLLSLSGSGRGLWGEDVDATLRDLREEWE